MKQAPDMHLNEPKRHFLKVGFACRANDAQARRQDRSSTGQCGKPRTRAHSTFCASAALMSSGEAIRSARLPAGLGLLAAPLAPAAGACMLSASNPASVGCLNAVGSPAGSACWTGIGCVVSVATPTVSAACTSPCSCASPSARSCASIAPYPAAAVEGACSKRISKILNISCKGWLVQENASARQASKGIRPEEPYRQFRRLWHPSLSFCLPRSWHVTMLTKSTRPDTQEGTESRHSISTQASALRPGWIWPVHAGCLGVKHS